jgi:hypothetical protein
MHEAYYTFIAPLCTLLNALAPLRRCALFFIPAISSLVKYPGEKLLLAGINSKFCGHFFKT